MTKSYFAAPKNTRLNSTYYFIKKIQNKQGLQQTTFNHPSDSYKKFTVKPYSFFVIDSSLTSDNSEKILEKIC